MNSQRHAAALSLFVLGLALICKGCVVSKYSEGILTDSITLTDLNPKLLPLAIDVDADPKDTLYRSRTRYKPATASGFGKKSKDTRLMLRGKQDGAALRAELGVEFLATEYELHVRVGFDPNKTTGLVDGQSLAFFDLVLDTAAEGAPPLRRIEAVYDAPNNGFMVRATDDTAPLGMTRSLGNTSEVVLQFRMADDELTMEAGASSGPFVFDFSPLELYAEKLDLVGGERQTVGWGARGLDKKGTLYINQLTLGGILPDIGTAETPIAMMLADAFQEARSAALSSNFPTAASAIEGARESLEAARDGIQAALDQGTFGPATQGELSLKNIEKALKVAMQGEAVADKQANGGQKTKPINKKGLRLVRSLQVGFAQLAGYKSNKFKRLFKTGFLPFGI